MTDLKTDSLNEKTVQLIQLAVDTVNSLVEDLKERDIDLSPETIDFVADFMDLYHELNTELDERGTLQ